MTKNILLYLSYIFGLLVSDLPPTIRYSLILIIVVVGVGLSKIPKKKYDPYQYKNATAKTWLIAGLISVIASWYLHLMTPVPSNQDISRFITLGGSPTTITGTINSPVRLTRTQNAQFWLKAETLNQSQIVTGKLYVTAPLIETIGIYPSDKITLIGTLYKPQGNQNQISRFNFEEYLKNQGSFAGFKATKIIPPQQPVRILWGWWVLRNRILKAQVSALGTPEGQLVSAMVMGNQVVDIPFNIRDSFTKTGLSHALSASGFHVAVILGVLLTVVKHFSKRVQYVSTTIALLSFIGLASVQPAIMRAVIMGFGVLIGFIWERKVKPLSSLLLCITILLMINPIWIWDLGFQLSMLATLGLMVTVKAMVDKLNWIPNGITILLAVPISATIWTLPLQIYYFSVINPYGILVNLIAAPILSIITLGGFVSGIMALINPTIGGAIALIVYYPTHILIYLTQLISKIPGSAIAVGKIEIPLLILFYFLISLPLISHWWSKYWWIIPLIIISIVTIPIAYQQQTLTQITLIPSRYYPSIIIEDLGNISIINAGSGNLARYTILPYLQQQGINQIDYLINPNPRYNRGQSVLENNLTIKETLIKATNIKTRSFGISLNPPFLEIVNQKKTWLILGRLNKSEQKQELLNLKPVNVLWWNGEPLIPEVIRKLRPKMAISPNPPSNNIRWLFQEQKTKLYITSSDLIQWNLRSNQIITPNLGQDSF